MNETRPCPECKKKYILNQLIRGDHEFTCECGATLTLEWERIETDDGPEDCYWLELKD